MSRCLTHLSVKDCPQVSQTTTILHKARVFQVNLRFLPVNPGDGLSLKIHIKALPDLPPNYDELFKNETDPIEKLNNPPEYVTTAAK